MQEDTWKMRHHALVNDLMAHLDCRENEIVSRVVELCEKKGFLEIDIMSVLDDVGVSTIRDVIFEVRALRRERRVVGNQAYIAAMELARDVIQERDRARARAVMLERDPCYVCDFRVHGVHVDRWADIRQKLMLHDRVLQERDRLQKLLRTILAVTDQQTRTTSQGEVRWEMWERLLWIGDQIEKAVAPAPNARDVPELTVNNAALATADRSQPASNEGDGKAGGDMPAWMTKQLRTNIRNGNGELVGYIDEHGIKHDVRKEAKKRDAP